MKETNTYKILNLKLSNFLKITYVNSQLVLLTQHHQSTHRQGITSLPCSRNGTLGCQEDLGNVFPYVSDVCNRK